MSPRRAFYNEIDPFCCDVLRARIADGSLPPGVVDPRDVRTVHPEELREYGQIHLFAGLGGGALACRLAGVPDDFQLTTAGVPCQPASVAGKQLGADDERWLWPDFFRLLRGLRSHYALVEQPPGIVSLHGGLEWSGILGTLAEIRTDFQLSRVSAEAVGAPHGRDRVWIVAYPAEPRQRGRSLSGITADSEGDGECGILESERGGGSLGDPESGGRGTGPELGVRRAIRECEGVGDTGRGGVQHLDDARISSGECGEGDGETRPEHDQRHAWRYGQLLRPWSGAIAIRGYDDTIRLGPWGDVALGAQPSLRTLDDGLSAQLARHPLWPVSPREKGRVARLRAVGNAWCPQAAVPALRVILAHYEQTLTAGVA